MYILVGEGSIGKIKEYRVHLLVCTFVSLKGYLLDGTARNVYHATAHKMPTKPVAV